MQQQQGSMKDIVATNGDEIAKDLGKKPKLIKPS
jgi:hypothetical protein